MPSVRQFFRPAQVNRDAASGQPQPLAAQETRAGAGQAWNLQPGYGYALPSTTGRSDMGAAGVVNSFGKVLTNPIGAGVVALHRPQASYGMAGQYIDHTIFWASRTIPTTIPLGPLTSPAVLEALLGTVNVQAAVRTT
jgi:hypothetical protein